VNSGKALEQVPTRRNVAGNKLQRNGSTWGKAAKREGGVESKIEINSKGKTWVKKHKLLEGWTARQKCKWPTI
jgi:hypothetical protein